jgi:hypothetical protein
MSPGEGSCSRESRSSHRFAGRTGTTVVVFSRTPVLRRGTEADLPEPRRGHLERRERVGAVGVSDSRVGRSGGAGVGCGCSGEGVVGTICSGRGG